MHTFFLILAFVAILFLLIFVVSQMSHDTFSLIYFTATNTPFELMRLLFEIGASIFED